MPTRLRYLFRLLAAAVCLGLFASPTPAWACSCMVPPQPSLAFSQADAVFTGRVTSVVNYGQLPLAPQVLQWLNSASYYNYYNEVTFLVSDSWKGVTTTTVVAHTGQSGGGCGYPFALGQQYVVYADNYSGMGLETNSCTRTSEAALAAADLSYLTTLPKLTLSGTPAILWPYCLGAAVLGAMLVGGIGWAIRKRARAR